MLGVFAKGMEVKIPARFQDQNKNPVDMENVLVRVEHFNEAHREMMTILDDVSMEKITAGQYLYKFIVPPHAGHGNYLVRIKAKMVGNRSDIQEATDYFQVRDDAGLVDSPSETLGAPSEPEGPKDYSLLSPIKNANADQSQPSEPSPNVLSEEDMFDQQKKSLVEQVSKMKQESTGIKSTRHFVEDLVVDVENRPVQGAHVNVYEKTSFMPRSPENLLVASAITDESGKWKMALPEGEYVFVYKGIGMRENREFRKV